MDRALEPRHNDIVIAVVDGELTVKRLEKRRGKVRLILTTLLLRTAAIYLGWSLPKLR